MRNVGILLTPIRTFIPEIDVWQHSLGVNVSEFTQVHPRREQNCGSLTVQSQINLCATYFPLISALQQLDRSAALSLAQTIGHMYDILHVSVPSRPIDRQRRGLMNFVGSAARYLFGVATEEELQRTNEMFKQLQQRTATALGELSVHTDKMASFMAISNKRFSQFQTIIQTQNVQFQEFLDNYRSNYHGTQVAQLLIAEAVQSLQNFVMTIEAVNSFEQAILLGAHGLMTPELIPPQIVNDTIQQLNRIVSTLHNPGFPVRTRIEDVYSSHDYHIWVEQDMLYITLKLPLSATRNPLTLYQVTTVSTPVPNKSDHLTRVVNLPKTIAFNADDDLFMTFDDTPQIPESNLLSLKRTTHLFQNKSDPSCVSAIVNRDTLRIAASCSFELLPNVRRPQVLHLGGSRLLLVNIDEYTLHCQQGSKVFKPEKLVEFMVPCSCAFRSKYGNYFATTTQCTNFSLAVTEPQYSFPVNIPFLSTFFSDDVLSHLATNEALTEQIQVIVPDIEVKQHQLNQQNAEFQTQSLHLEQVANLTQANAEVYRSMADRFLYALDRDQYPIRSTALAMSSWQNLIYLGTSILSVILAILLYFLYGRVRTLSMAIALASHVPAAVAASLIAPQPALTYYVPTEPPSLSISVEMDHRIQTWESILLLALVGIVAFMWFHWYRTHKHITDSFRVFLEVGNPQTRVLIPLLKLPHTPAQYDFVIQAPISSLHIKGFFQPVALIEWPSVHIRNMASRIVYPLQTSVKLNHRQAYLVHQVIQDTFYHLLVIYHQHQLIPLKMPSDMNVVRRPTSNSLYPSLTALPPTLITPTLSSHITQAALSPAEPSAPNSLVTTTVV